MKVVLAIDALTPNLTGIGRYTWELVKGLKESAIVSKAQFYRHARYVANPEKLLDPHYDAQAKPFVSLPRKTRDKIMNVRCKDKVFHGPNYFLPECADFGVATIHDLSVFKHPESHPAERIEHFARSFESTVSKARHLITDTETTRREVIEYLGWKEERITAIPLGVSNDFCPRGSGIAQETLQRYGLIYGQYLLCVSTIEPRKKILELLHAFSQLPDALKRSYPLVLIGGKGWLSEHIHDEIKKMEASSFVKYLGFVAEVDLPVVYAGARAFVYPSCYEGFGLPVIEAMASGVPVLTSNQSTLPEISKGAAMHVNPEDIDGFTDALKKLLLDHAWRFEATTLGLHVANGYSWRTCAERTISVYKSISN